MSHSPTFTIQDKYVLLPQHLTPRCQIYNTHTLPEEQRMEYFTGVKFTEIHVHLYRGL